MSTVLLIHGDPGAGKSTLGRRLGAEFGWHTMDLDADYVRFIEKYCPGLYFPWMAYFIWDHYTNLVGKTEWVNRWFYRDIKSEWHAHLGRTALDAAGRHSKVAIFGWLLAHRRPELVTALSSGGAAVHEIHVVKVTENDRRYRHLQVGELSVDQLNGLAP